MMDLLRGETSPAVGLDVGTSRIVVAQRAGQQIAYESQLNAFVTIPHSKITQTAFERERVPHAVVGNEISVHGNEDVYKRQVTDHFSPRAFASAQPWFLDHQSACNSLHFRLQ